MTVIRHTRLHGVLLRAVGLATAVLLHAAACAAGDDAPLPLLDYRTASWHLMQSPGVTGGPAGGLFNPAAAALNDAAALDLWLDDADDGNGLDNFGFGFGRTLGLVMNRRTLDWNGARVHRDDWQLGLAGGGRRGTVGVGYRWSGGDGRVPRERALALGFVSRPGRGFSLGAARVASLQSDAAQNVIDLGLRPLGSAALTLFADWTVDDDQRFLDDGSWGAGLEVRPLRGVSLGVRSREEPATGNVGYALFVGLTSNDVQGAYGSGFDHDGNESFRSYMLRSRPPFRGHRQDLLSLRRYPQYFAVDLQNRHLGYQKARLFDDENVAWLDLLRLLDAVRDDEAIDIVAFNLSGLRTRPSLLWELRSKLQELRDAGKEVLVHADRLSLGSLYLASAADRLTIEPQGEVSIPGVALTRSYLKGTLAKVGIGFQELRYFKYKSMVETFSRDSMSAADRAQRQRVADVLFETMRDGIAAGRGLATADVDTVIDGLGVLMPDEAMAAGLVDTVTRWDAELKRLHGERGARPAPVPESARRVYWDEQWGAPPVIPVVYAVGPCATDEGIRGRATSAYLRRLARDRSVAAVVLRADSPGGFPLPADLVADAVRKLREAGKPVVVSQGDMAASGGYMISMDGSRILTTPLTVTGSIGVISGWVWDDGAAAKVGVTADDVHRGRHADLYSRVSLPLVGSLPRRPMNEAELSRAETVIRAMYGEFVAAVAHGRGLSVARVDSLAQGRVWMGGDAIDRGLCDGFGGLGDAIVEASRLAGIAPGRDIRIVEYPPRPWIKWPTFGPRLPSLYGVGDRLVGLVGDLVDAVRGRREPAALPEPNPWAALGLDGLEADYVRDVADHPGSPLLLTAPDVLPDDWRRPE